MDIFCDHKSVLLNPTKANVILFKNKLSTMYAYNLTDETFEPYRGFMTTQRSKFKLVF